MKTKKQKRIFKTHITRERSGIIDSAEKAERLLGSLLPAERKAMMHDLADFVEDQEGKEDERPTRFVDKGTANRLLEGFNRVVEKGKAEGKRLEPGVYVKATSADGYIIEGWVVPTSMPAHSTKGKPFAMEITITDSEGYRILSR